MALSINTRHENVRIKTSEPSLANLERLRRQRWLRKLIRPVTMLSRSLKMIRKASCHEIPDCGAPIHQLRFETHGQKVIYPTNPRLPDETNTFIRMADLLKVRWMRLKMTDEARKDADILLLNTCSISWKGPRKRWFHAIGSLKQSEKRTNRGWSSRGGCVPVQEGQAIIDRAPL